MGFRRVAANHELLAEIDAVLPPGAPGEPTEKGFIEAFNGKLRDECLNANQFLSIEDARSKIEAWRMDYNHLRPHSSLGQRSPAEHLEGQQRGDGTCQ
jgi:putative transposase